MWYLISFTLTLSFSSLQMGFVMSAPAVANKPLRYQLHWGDNVATIEFYKSILNAACIVGIGVGSIFGGDFVKTGRRRSIIMFNIVGLMGSFISMLVNFHLICLGRFILGFTTGILLCATPKALDETIPGKLIDKGFGTSTNIMINCAFLVLMIGANFIPEDKVGLQETAVWQYLFAI
jgi:MFS family permease